MHPTNSSLIKYEMPDDETAYLDHPEPFELLEISTAGKSIPELYRELNSLAEGHFLEYCYLSKKNYTYTQFETSNIYKRYMFLKTLLHNLSFWLHNGRENLPFEVQLIMNEGPDFENPWGVREPVKTLRWKPFTRKK